MWLPCRALCGPNLFILPSLIFKQIIYCHLISRSQQGAGRGEEDCTRGIVFPGRSKAILSSCLDGFHVSALRNENIDWPSSHKNALSSLQHFCSSYGKIQNPKFQQRKWLQSVWEREAAGTRACSSLNTVICFAFCTGRLWKHTADTLYSHNKKLYVASLFA